MIKQSEYFLLTVGEAGTYIVSVKIYYHKQSNISDTQKIAVIETSHEIMALFRHP